MKAISSTSQADNRTWLCSDSPVGYCERECTNPIPIVAAAPRSILNPWAKQLTSGTLNHRPLQHRRPGKRCWVPKGSDGAQLEATQIDEPDVIANTPITAQKPRSIGGATSRPQFTKGVREAVGNIAWLGSDRILRLGGALLVGTAVARYLGPSNFGIMSYAGAIFAMFNNLSSLGLDMLVVRDVALHPDAEDEILGTAFLLKVAASCVTTLAAICFAWLVRPQDHVTLEMIILLSCAGIFQGFDVVDYFLQAKTRSRYSVFPKSIVFVLASLARLAAVILKVPLMAFVWIAALEMMFSELSLGAAYFTFHQRLRPWSFSWERSKTLLSESWPLMCSSLLILVYMRCDQIVLGTLSTPAAVGVYSASTKIAEIWYAIPVIVCSTVMPRLMRARNQDPPTFARRLQHLYDSMAGLSILIAIVITTFGRYLILLLYGRKYLAAVPVLSVQIWTAVFVFIGCVGGSQMVYEKLTIIQLHRSAAGAVANVALNLLLVPRFGAIGSAIATLIVQATVSYGLDLLSPKTRHIFWYKTRSLYFRSLTDGSMWRKEQSA
jgi:O-antigen/teichoic acid export membrane protein